MELSHWQLGQELQKQKPKKKVENKGAPKPTAPPVTELLKKEFGPLNEWSEVDTGPKRWGGAFTAKDVLTEFERKGGKDNVNEGPAYEYAKSTKNIEKSWKNTHKAVMGLVKELQKKGLKKEAFKIEKLIERVWSEFDHFFEETMDKLQ